MKIIIGFLVSLLFLEIGLCLENNAFIVDTNIVYSFARYHQKIPCIGFDGMNNLVVWEDYRDTTVDIYGARITESGMVLDPAGIPISYARNDQYKPAVASGLGNYLVVWEDLRAGSEIYGARVTSGGLVLDTSGIPITSAPNTQARPAVAFDGTNYLVVWQDNRSGLSFDIYGARVTIEGVVIDTSGIMITSAPKDQESPVVGFDGVNYFVIWQDWRNDPGTYTNSDIYGARVTQSGVVLDTEGIQVCGALNNQYLPHLDFDGTNYLVVWEDYRGGIYSDIYGTRVTPSGIIIDTSAIAISIAENYQTAPRVTYAGDNYFVLWADQRTGSYPDIYGARVSASGAVLDTTGIKVTEIPFAQYMPVIGFNHTHYVAVWQDFRNSDLADIYGARIMFTGSVIDTAGILISTEANFQEEPQVAFDGTNYLLVWQDWRNDAGDRRNADIYGIRISSSGTILDSAPIAICTAINNQVHPRIAFDGINYLVVWEDWRYSPFGNSDIYGVRVSPSGMIIDSVDILISSAPRNQNTPSVCFGGTNYLVVWKDCRNHYYGHIYATRVTTTGIVLDSAGIPICTAGSKAHPEVSFDGTNYFIVWQQKDYIGWDDVYGARLNPGGNLIDTLAKPISTAPYDQINPSIAFDGVNYFVVWQDARGFPPPDTDIYGARVSSSGIVLDTAGIPLAPSNYSQHTPSVLWGSVDYLVLYGEWRYTEPANGWDIYGLRVSPSGIIIDSFAIANKPGDQVSPALAKGPGEQIMITYSGYADSVNNHIARMQRIWAEYFPPVGTSERMQRFINSPLTIYPNPFREKVIIRYTMQDTRYTIQDTRYRIPDIILKIYDVSGRIVKSFNLESCIMYHESVISWDGTDGSGRKLPSGVYFIRLETEGFKKNEKVILLR